MPIKKSSHNFLLKPFAVLFKRFHLTIFFIFIIAGLAVAVILVNNILTGKSEDENYTSSISAGTIDQTTLEHIQSLHTSDAPSALPEPPAGRINPFNE